jgi:hypothetical protein
MQRPSLMKSQVKGGLTFMLIFRTLDSGSMSHTWTRSGIFVNMCLNCRSHCLSFNGLGSLPPAPSDADSF